MEAPIRREPGVGVGQVVPPHARLRTSLVDRLRGDEVLGAARVVQVREVIGELRNHQARAVDDRSALLQRRGSRRRVQQARIGGWSIQASVPQNVEPRVDSELQDWMWNVDEPTTFVVQSTLKAQSWMMSPVAPLRAWR